MAKEKFNLVVLDKIPPCDLCKNIGVNIEAYVDGKTTTGQWAFMCRYCYSNHGVGLGLGKGQLLKRKDSNE